jgi:cytochrome c oxidase cbb3-type subunit 3
MSAPQDQDPNKKVIHVYDGIEEEDNHLPFWWLGTLFGAIVFSFGYWLVFHTTKTMPNPGEEYAADVAALKKSRIEANPMSDEAMAELAKDAAKVEEGKQVFASTCASCHGQQGEGLVGPNLTDKFWVHGSAPTQIARAVSEGFPDKGMPPWGAILGPEKVRKVTAYVITLKGKNLPGKEPQGDPVD